MDLFSRLEFGQGMVQTPVLSRGRASPAISLYLCAIPGGRGLVSTAIKLILAIKKQSPLSPLVLAGLSLASPSDALMDALQLWLGPWQAAPHSADIIHFSQKAGNVLFNLSGV